ncbi:hypothetical protein [Sphingomonas solaris]|uniref:DUF4164 family protein n=1 Tax=Alterirhizorhabdus solaris TaxID=2529389 RepID=A0A558R1M0_9SPHN|nr:hypothetical protein [Sphingomonas solaris]TVV73273.1 hypothetical protein FOY91_12540 [Sphingomonas solaris]
MIEDRLSLAFGRLERAVARLETQLPLPPMPTDDGASEDAALRAQLSDLEERHETLRRHAAATVERLDRLLDPAREG